MRGVSPWRCAVVWLCLAAALLNGSARAQVVGDSSSNTINGTVVNLGSTNLVVGTNGPNTALVITNGGSLQNGSAQIGLNAGSSNNQVTVTGAGSAWVTQGDLTVGNFASRNTLWITNGASVRATGLVVGGEVSSTENLVTVGGGSLTVTNAGGAAVLDVRRGAVGFNGGTITTDRLMMTNAAGSFQFNSGTLLTAGATISNGQAFVVGAESGRGAATWSVASNAVPSTVGNGLVLGAGVAYALAFNGMNQYLAVSNFGAIAPTNEVTVEFWAFANSNVDQSAFVLEPDEVTNRFNGHINYTDEATYFDFGNVSNVNARIAYPNPPGTISNWIHYALVASQSSNYMRIYRNGILVAGRPGMTPFQRRTQELRIGGSTGLFFHGRLDEFRLWNTALAQSQIQSNLSRVLDGREAGLLLYYRFDSTNGLVATNSAVATGAAYNGALVNGPAWVPSGALQAIGGSADQASLFITNGGQLVVTGNSLLGNTGSSSNNQAVIAGANSVWTTSGGLRVGASGAFNSLLISNGGAVMSQSAVLGYAAAAMGNRAEVTGPNTLWAVSNQFDLGALGSGNVLLVTNGGRVTNAVLNLGAASTANGNEAIIAGTGAVLSSGSFNVGQLGFSNRIQIHAGAQASAGATYVGNGAGATNNQVIVNGLNALLTNSGDVYVGLMGSRNELLVTNGAQALNRFGYVGYGVSARDNQATIAGANSAWVNSGELQVGNAGAGNALSILEGARVLSSQGIVGNAIGASNNAVTVTGSGSLWSNANNFQVGNFGGLNRLMVSEGGRLINGAGYVGYDSDSSNNYALVTGPGSLWTNATDLTVGFQGAGNLLVVSNAGQVADRHGFIGFQAGANSNQVVVAGTNTLWINSGDLFVGNFGAGNSLRISNGATVRALNATVGANAGSVGNLVTVNAGSLTVTNAGSTSVLDVRRGRIDLDGGTIVTDQLRLTNASGRFTFNAGTLDTRVAVINNGPAFTVGGAAGSGPATWIVRSNVMPSTVAGGFVLGANAGNARLLLTNGATLQVAGTSTIGQNMLATNSLALVSGPGSFWQTGGFLYVGFDGADNSLVISNRGRVRSDFGFIGDSAGGGHGNQVTVTGVDSSWSNSGSLYVGNAGSSNTLRILAGGVVLAGSVYVGADAMSTGNMLALTNGTLIVTNGSETAELDVRNGSAELSGGLLVVDELRVTNSGGSFSFNGGTVDVRGSRVANGNSFLIGDGSLAATFHLSGAATNRHVFADGLVIASNATLLGNGVLVGAVTNRGTLAAGDSAGSLRIEGNLNLAASAGMVFEIGGLLATNQFDQINVTNFVQFAGTFSLALIGGFVPAPSDSFTLMNFASRLGTFANAPEGGKVTTIDQRGRFTVTYSGTNLVVGNFEPTLIMVSVIPTASNATVRFRALAGVNYQMEYSATLTNWMPVLGAVFSTPLPGITQWIDDGTLTGGLSATRFYRVRQLP